MSSDPESQYYRSPILYHDTSLFLSNLPACYFFLGGERGGRVITRCFRDTHLRFWFNKTLQMIRNCCVVILFTILCCVCSDLLFTLELSMRSNSYDITEIASILSAVLLIDLFILQIIKSFVSSMGMYFNMYFQQTNYYFLYSPLLLCLHSLSKL